MSFGGRDDVTIRISAKNLTQKEFDAARRQLDNLGKQAGLAKGGFAQLGQGAQRAVQDIGRFNPAASQASVLLGGFGAAGLAAAAGIGAVAAAAASGVSHVVALGDEITTLSSKTGLSTDFLQELSHASAQLDVPFEQAARAVSKLQVNLGKATTTQETADALDQIGISIAQLRGLKPEEQFLQVAAGLILHLC